MQILIRHKARLEQPESRQIGDPGRIVHVRLAAGNRLDVRGVGDDHRELAVAQYLPDRHPVDAGGFHRDHFASTRNQPFQKAQKPVRRGLEGSTFVRRLAPGHQADARHDAVLVDVQARHTLVHHLHDRLHRSRRRQGRRCKNKAKKQAPGRRRPYAQVGIMTASRVQLAIELDGVSEKPTSCRRRQILPPTVASRPFRRFIHGDRPKGGPNSQ